jgi:hypothetical protein
MHWRVARVPKGRVLDRQGLTSGRGPERSEAPASLGRCAGEACCVREPAGEGPRDLPGADGLQSGAGIARAAGVLQELCSPGIAVLPDDHVEFSRRRFPVVVRTLGGLTRFVDDPKGVGSRLDSAAMVLCHRQCAGGGAANSCQRLRRDFGAEFVVVTVPSLARNDDVGAGALRGLRRLHLAPDKCDTL